MALSLPLRRASSSLLTSTAVRRSLSCRFLSSGADGGSDPLILWLPPSPSANTASSSTATAPRRILMPDTTNWPQVDIASPQDVVHAVNKHYELGEDESSSSSTSTSSRQFVGGMGESDEGVWFACRPCPENGSLSLMLEDPLQHSDLIQDSIQAVKEARHGVPFGTFTSGVGLPPDLPNRVSGMGLSRLQVSLLAANPNEYAQAMGVAELSSSEATNRFGQVCGFCVALAESGFPLEVGVLNQYASSARDLAVSLGAVDVHIFNE